MINRNHKNYDNGKTYCRRFDTGGNGFFPKLRPHNLGMQLLQLQLKSANPDGGCKLLGSFIGKVSRNLRLSVGDSRVYIRGADNRAVIINSDGFSVLKGLCGCVGKLLRSLLCHG